MGKRLLIVIMIGLFTLVGTGGCKSSYSSRKQKEVAKVRQQRKKEAMKQYEDAVKRHRSIQTKETRKRIRKNEKEAKRKSQGRRKFFLFRWFSGDN